NLADQGVLAAYDSPSAADIPAQFKDPQHRWAATAVRVRVLAVAENLPAGVRIESIEDLKNFALKDRIAMAAPSAGTTGGHVAALYTIWGEQKADAYFQSLHDNGVHLLGGNSVVAEMVASGQMLAGLTDNDDVSEAKEQGGNLSAIIPDQRPDQIGTLAMPTSVALVAGAKNPANARKLIDFLLSRQTEKRLIDAHFVLLSVRPDMNAAASPKFMQVDYPAVARMMPQAIQRSTAILEGR
ncbi:MAG TPA: extracellular solute-binding protein, partial [Tepidisphaeraceae bacterium]